MAKEIKFDDEILDKILALLDNCGPFWNRLYVIVKGFSTIVDGDIFPHILKYNLLCEYIIRNITDVENLDDKILEKMVLIIESILIRVIESNKEKFPHNDIAETVLKRISGVNSIYANVLLNSISIIWERYFDYIKFPDQELMVQAESVDDEKLDPSDFQILRDAIETGACIHRNRFTCNKHQTIINEYFTIFNPISRSPSPSDDILMPPPPNRDGMRIPAPRWIVRLLLFMATIFSPNCVRRENLGFPDDRCKISTLEQFKSYLNYPSVRYAILASKSLEL